MFKWLNAVWIYIGSVIGAGFATGQELQTFFSFDFGFYGILLAGVLFILCGVRVFADSYDGAFQSYEEYLLFKTGKLAPFFKWVSVLFCGSSFCVMAAGVQSVAADFSIPLGGVWFTLLCFFIFLKGVGGLAVVNLISTPVIIAGIFLVGLQHCIPVFHSVTGNGIFYVSYNMLGCLPVMCVLYPYFQKRKQAVVAGIIGGSILFVLMILIWHVLPASKVELPMFTLAKDVGLGGLYGIILLLAMLTTAVSSGLGFLNALSIKPIYANLLLCAAAVLLLPFGFSLLVEKLYTAFGMVSAALIFFLLKKKV